jgi:hypothetical protein
MPCVCSSRMVKKYRICPIRIEIIHGRHRVVQICTFIFFTKKISQFLNLAVEDILVLYPSMQKKKKITDFSPEKNLCLVIFGCKLRNNSNFELFNSTKKRHKNQTICQRGDIDIWSSASGLFC